MYNAIYYRYDDHYGLCDTLKKNTDANIVGFRYGIIFTVYKLGHTETIKSVTSVPPSPALPARSFCEKNQ